MTNIKFVAFITTTDPEHQVKFNFEFMSITELATRLSCCKLLYRDPTNHNDVESISNRCHFDRIDIDSTSLS